jgi:hypothetical protein
MSSEIPAVTDQRILVRARCRQEFACVVSIDSSLICHLLMPVQQETSSLINSIKHACMQASLS